nr:MAG TPA: hypothetical protein [Caudoviricetes sp.]
MFNLFVLNVCKRLLKIWALYLHLIGCRTLI